MVYRKNVKESAGVIATLATHVGVAATSGALKKASSQGILGLSPENLIPNLIAGGALGAAKEIAAIVAAPQAVNDAIHGIEVIYDKIVAGKQLTESDHENLRKNLNNIAVASNMLTDNYLCLPQMSEHEMEMIHKLVAIAKSPDSEYADLLSDLELTDNAIENNTINKSINEIKSLLRTFDLIDKLFNVDNLSADETQILENNITRLAQAIAVLNKYNIPITEEVSKSVNITYKFLTANPQIVSAAKLLAKVTIAASQGSTKHVLQGGINSPFKIIINASAGATFGGSRELAKILQANDEIIQTIDLAEVIYAALANGKTIGDKDQQTINHNLNNVANYVQKFSKAGLYLPEQTPKLTKLLEANSTTTTNSKSNIKPSLTKAYAKTELFDLKAYKKSLKSAVNEQNCITNWKGDSRCEIASKNSNQLQSTIDFKSDRISHQLASGLDADEISSQAKIIANSLISCTQPGAKLCLTFIEGSDLKKTTHLATAILEHLHKYNSEMSITIDCKDNSIKQELNYLYTQIYADVISISNRKNGN